MGGSALGGFAGPAPGPSAQPSPNLRAGRAEDTEAAHHGGGRAQRATLRELDSCGGSQNLAGGQVPSQGRAMAAGMMFRDVTMLP